MLTKESANQFIQDVFTKVWCERNKDVVSKYYHPEFLGLLHGKEEFTYSDVLKRIDYSKAYYGKSRLESYEVFSVENDRMVVRVSMEGIELAANQKVKFHFMIIIEMKEGKMYRQWALSSNHYRYKEWEKE